MKSDTIEEAFKDYLASSDKTVTIEGECYYKAICKKYCSFSFGNVIEIMLPSDMFKSSSVISGIKDEKGNKYILTGPEMLGFSGGNIPEWYLKCMMFWIKESDNKDVLLQNVGSYFTACK